MTRTRGNTFAGLDVYEYPLNPAPKAFSDLTDSSSGVVQVSTPTGTVAGICAVAGGINAGPASPPPGPVTPRNPGAEPFYQGAYTTIQDAKKRTFTK